MPMLIRAAWPEVGELALMGRGCRAGHCHGAVVGAVRSTRGALASP